MKSPFSRLTGQSVRMWFLPIAGLVALAWFLIRVIPKPSRAAYPCMKVAYPMASTFVLFLLGLATTAFSLDRMKFHYRRSRHIVAVGFLVVAIVGGFIAFQADQAPVFANSSSLDTANVPMGVGRGIFPGRVVWEWNPNATNELCGNSTFRDAYYLPKNTNMEVVDGMLRSSLLQLTGKSTVGEAWDTLFVYFNARKGRGSVGYQAGEKIFIKLNGVGATVVDSSDHSITNLANYVMARTSPQPVLALLRGLVNDYGIPQENISVGDPQRDIQNEYWDLWHAEFPDVRYICNKGGQGRTFAARGTQPSVVFSDKGAVLRSGSWADMSVGTPIYQDTLFAVLEEADYLIYVGALKVHERAGVTLVGKADFGSQTRRNAMHMHMGLVNPDGFGPVGNTNSRFGYNKYRVLVDLMGHEKLGGNALLFVVDGLYGGRGANLDAVKFQIAPFNNDWPSSIFMSQDPIALESVCQDILKAEFTSDRHAETYPQMIGVDDHLHQAADSANWPTGIRYDPENDGTVIGGLGVHEHWNNATAMEYSRNLGTGNGIELVKVFSTVGVAEESGVTPRSFGLDQNYPNPFNPVTRISYRVTAPSAAEGPRHIRLAVYDLIGREVAVLVDEKKPAGVFMARWDAQGFPSGVYLCRITAGEKTQTRKMILAR